MKNTIVATLLLLSTGAIADDYAMGDGPRRRREYPNENFSQRVREYDQWVEHERRGRAMIRDFYRNEREKEERRKSYERIATGEYE